MRRLKYLFAALLFMIFAVPALSATTIKVKVDMTVLWGNDLPEKVYMFAFLNSKTGSYYNVVPNLSITAKYNSTLEGTSIDQDVTGALGLVDPDGDGIYEGTITYTGSTDVAFHTRLFISKNDPNNAVHFPKYEDKTGASETDIIDTQNFRTVTISGGKVLVGWDGSKIEQAGGIWNTAWENKTINGFYVATPITIWKDLSVKLTVNAGYDNAKSDLRRDVTKYVSITSADSYKVQVVKSSSGVSLLGKVVTSSLVAVTAGRNEKSGVMYVEVKLPPITEAFQTIIMMPEGGVNKDKNCTIGGVSDFDGKMVKGASLLSINDTLNFKSDTFGFALFNKTDNIWQATAAKNGVMIPIKKQANTAVYNVSFIRENEPASVIATVPVSIPSMTLTATGSKATLRWEENIAKYGSTYAKEEILVRVSRIDAEPVSLRYDVYNASNPIRLGYGTTGEENIKVFNNKSVSYVDFLFTAGVSETKLASDGKTVQYRLSNTDKSVSFTNFQPEKYKVQIYTIKQGNKYAVTTFEKEYPFEITAESSIYNGNEENYYLINEVSSKEFRTIKVGVTTKTTDSIDLSMNNIYYNGTQALIGEKRNSTGVFDSGKPTAKPIKVEEDTSYRGVKPPLDIILCLDSSNSMKDRMPSVKAAWAQFENDMSIRGYDVKYKLIRFGGEKYNSSFEIQSGWADGITEDKFYTDSNDSGYTGEKSDHAIMEGLKRFDAEGRYLGADSNGNWAIIQNSSNGTPSAKVIIFITDANANNRDFGGIEPNILESEIRLRNVMVSGLGGVKKDGLMLEDDYIDPVTGKRIPADYPVGFANDNEQHYYHLKLLLGNRFKFYQITNNSNTILAQLKQGIGRVSVVKRWIFTYVTPNGYRDGTERSAEFNISINGKEVIYGGEAKDRTYIAPYIQTTSAAEDQTLIFKFRDITKTRLSNATYKLEDNFALGNSYRRMKAIDIAEGKGLDDIETNFDYSGDRNFEKDPDNKSEAGVNYGDVWTYPGDISKSGLMIRKVSGVGDGTLNKATTDLTDTEIDANLSEQLFNYGYNSKIHQVNVTEDGDNVTITWEKGDISTAIPFTNSRYMFRLMREEADWYYSPYDKETNDTPVAPILGKGSRKINYMDSVTPITLPNGDTTTQANQKMDTFLRDGGYVDFIFGEDELESTNVLGVRIDYSAGKLNIVGLPKRPDNKKYKLKIYSFKDGTSTIKDRNGSIKEAADFRVITYNQDVTFTSGNPAIVDMSIGKDGIFRVDYIDTTNFNQINVHFSTKMPYEIKKPEVSNIFRDSSLISQTGTVDRVTEFQYNSKDSTISEATAISGLNVTESDLREYRMPLDIVFCIDNSGSMATEIAKVKAGLKQFSKTLIQRGFDVKYNLITFGPAQTSALNGNFTGISPIREKTSDANAYMVQFKQKWFDGTYAVNKNPTNEEIGFQTGDSEEEIAFKKQQYIEVNELEKAFSGIGSTGGYYKYQENSVWAFDRAKTLLDTNGRAVDYKGSIITAEQASTTPTTMKSLKWIIFLTDEGIDNDTAPSGYSKKVRGVVPKTTVGTTTIPTVIKEVGDELNESGIYLTGIHHIGKGRVDKRGIAGVTSDDTDDGVIYNQYAVVMGEKYNGYEMGSDGGQTTNALLDSVSNIGIIQRWKLTYTTPFDKADGTFRQINFIPANLTGTTSTVKIKPKDVNPVAVVDSDVGGRTIVSTRKYKAPFIAMEVDITNPVTDGVFNFAPTNLSNVIIEGKARALDEKTQKPMAPEKLTIKVFNNEDRTLIKSLDYVVNSSTDMLPDGYYKFYVEIPVADLKGSGAKLFDVSAVAIRTGMSGQTEENRISLDSGAPKIVGLEVLNNTTYSFWKNIKQPEDMSNSLFDKSILSDGTLSKLKYDYSSGENSYAYASGWASAKEVTLNERNKSYDGHYSKNGDNLEISLDFIDENFDITTVNATGVSDKNIIKANFKELTGVDALVAPSLITPEDIEINRVKGKKIHAKFEITVKNTMDTVGKAKFVVIDKLGRSMEEMLKTIEISNIDNKKPDGASYGSPSIINSSDSQVVITKDSYKVKAAGESKLDTNGFRLYKVKYSYDSKMSDFGSSGRGSLLTGKHDKDYTDGNNKYFYIIAGNGINTNADGSLLTGIIAGTSLAKIPDTNHGDDGKYIFKQQIAVVDKAGNETDITDTDGPVLYVDTQAPRINNQVLKKKKDAENLSFKYPDDIVRQNDVAQIQYEVTDFNAASNTTAFTSAYDYYQKIGSYPEYSSLCAAGLAASPIIKAGDSESKEVIKTVTILVGDDNGKGNKDSAGKIIEPGIYVTNPNPGDANVAVYARDLAGNEATTAKASKIVSVPVTLEVNLEDPISNGQFSFVPGDNTKVRIKGKARAKEELEGINDKGILEKEYYNLELEKINIQVLRDINNNVITDNDYIINKDTLEKGGDKLSDGWYSFHLDVDVNELTSYAAELFDVKATLEKSGETKSKLADKVSIDAGPPKITSITVKNNTTAALWDTIYKTEKFPIKDKIFTADEIIKFSTTWYQLAESFKYENVSTISLDLTQRNKDCDGHYAKENDSLTVKVEFLEENFDKTNLNSVAERNVIKARFIGFGLNGAEKILEGVIESSSSETVGGVTGKKYTAVFNNLTVENAAEAATGSVVFDIRDNLSRASTEKLGAVQLTKIDNKLPGTGTVTDVIKSTGNPITITRDPYKVKVSGDADANGFRVFKLYYNYDSTQSDFGSKGRESKTGNHDNDGTDGSKYFYIKAGDGTNISGATTLEGTSDDKTPDLLSHGDDGKYTFRKNVLLIDKAGNISSADSTDGTRTLLVDTQAPKITGAVLKKTMDRDNLIFNYADNLVKQGDKAQIKYDAEDFNLGNKESLYNNSSYLEYSWLITKTVGGTVEERPVMVIGTATTDINTKMKKIPIKLGDAGGTIDTNNPQILITADAAVDKKGDIVLYAEDLAGNHATTSLNVELDNQIPTAPTVLAYAWESSLVNQSGAYTSKMADIMLKNRDDKDPTGALDNTVHFTAGGNDKNNFYLKITDTPEETSFVQAKLNGTEGSSISKTDLVEIGIGNSFVILSNLVDFKRLDPNGVNKVSVAVRDGAGNLSSYSSDANIVVDTRVGDGKISKTILGGTAINTGGNNYSFRLSVASIPELSGIQKVTVKRLIGTNRTGQVTGVMSVASSLNSSFTKVSAAGDLTFEVPAVMQGTRIKLETEILDNLGNAEIFNYEFLVPKRGVNIRSQAAGSEKEIRTNVRVVGENQFDLEQTEEAGKKK